MYPYDIYDDSYHWCPDCGLPLGVCHCEDTYDDRYNEDGEPDFTLDDLEWEERYPELSVWEDDE